MMAHDVFISYSIKDKPIADGICANLEAAGIRCWIAPRDIEPGEDWPTAIARAIPLGRVMVMVFSAHSNNSDQVYRELYLAAGNNAIIIPFKIEDVEPEPRMEFILAGKHWLDAITPPMQEQINILVKCVKTFLGGPLPPLPLPSRVQHPNPVRQMPAWVWGILITVMILAGGAAAVYWAGQGPKAIPLRSSIITPIENTQKIFSTPVSGSQADRARSFAAPILTAIANRKPDFEENFSNPNPDWYINPSQGGAMEEGVARLQANNGDVGMTDDRVLTGKDFVLQYDVRLVSGDSTSQINMGIHYISESNKYWLNLNPAIQAWDMGGNWGDEHFNSASGDTDALGSMGETAQITIITQGTRWALYLNQTPVGLMENNHFGIAGKTSFHCVSFSKAVCEFDNVKFWNLTDMAGLP
jgi:hypothetical protein